MLERVTIDKIYLSCQSTDMRRSINGLSIIVKEVFKLDPFSTSAFVFCNKKRDKIKILVWERNGFWLLYKRLEKGTFILPADTDAPNVIIDKRQLNWLLDGLTLDQKGAHGKVSANIVL